jgi:hypothetical protein
VSSVLSEQIGDSAFLEGVVHRLVSCGLSPDAECARQRHALDGNDAGWTRLEEFALHDLTVQRDAKAASDAKQRRGHRSCAVA